MANRDTRDLPIIHKGAFFENRSHGDVGQSAKRGTPVVHASRLDVQQKRSGMHDAHQTQVYSALFRLNAPIELC